MCEEITQQLARATHTHYPSPITHYASFLLSCAALAVVFWGLLQLDLPVARFVRSLDLPWLELAGEVGNRLGSGTVLVAISVSLLAAGLARKQPAFRRAGVESLIAHGAAALCVQVLKHLIGRPRPRLTHGDAGFQFGPSWDAGLDSFPSGHASASFAVVAVLATRFPKARWFFYGAASAVALSRVLRGSHFPTDVVAGVLLGLLVGSVVANPIRAWRSSVVQAVTDLSPYLVGVFALLWISVHTSQYAISDTVLLVAGVGIIVLGVAGRWNFLVRSSTLEVRSSTSNLEPQTARVLNQQSTLTFGANSLIGVGLALTTGSVLVTLLAALLVSAQWLDARGRESSPVEGQPVFVEAVSLASLALAVLAIQAIKGILPIL